MLTRQIIEADIEGFKDRIAKARAGLASLPMRAGSSKERQKIKTTRSKLITEVEHVGRLMGYAEIALDELDDVR